MRLVKKLICTVIALSIVFSAGFTAFADEEQSFVIENGVLLEYLANDADVIIPDGVYKIADNAFLDNTDITSVTLTDSVSIIGDNAFSGCTSLSKVTGGNGVATVGNNTFDKTQWISSFDSEFLTLGSVLVTADKMISMAKLPEGINAIAPNAFKNCSFLTNADLSEISDIGDYAFEGCTLLSDVTFSESLKYVGVNAFDDTKWITSCECDFVSANGILIKYMGEGGHVTVPLDIEQIAGGAFANNISVASVTLPEGLYYIGKNAFTKSPMIRITLPKTLAYIGDEAFSFCANLSEVEIPEKTTYMGVGAFYSCTSLKSFSTGGLTTLPYISLAKCTKLSEVRVGNALENIESYALAQCNSLHRIALPATVTSIKEKAFDGCENLTIAGVMGSVAYDYAIENGIEFDKLTDFILGDINGDGQASMMDVVEIQRYIAKLVEFNSEQLKKADLNGDTKISMEDVTTLQRKIAGLI